MKKSLKNKRKKVKSAHQTKSTKRSTKKVKRKINKTVQNKKKTPIALLQAEELFASLSLTSVEEHELLQSLFVSAVIKSVQRRDRKGGLPFEGQVVVQSNSKDVQRGLAKAEEKISRALNGSGDSDNDKEGGLSNLKYAEPKYKNVESILKYNETPDDRSGVKLVIMNFND